VSGPSDGSTPKVGVAVNVGVNVAVGGGLRHDAYEQVFMQVLLRHSSQQCPIGVLAGGAVVGVATTMIGVGGTAG
jgi:hypothetical protein